MNALQQKSRALAERAADRRRFLPGPIRRAVTAMPRDDRRQPAKETPRRRDR